MLTVVKPGRRAKNAAQQRRTYMKKSVLLFAGVLALTTGLAVGQEKDQVQAGNSKTSITGCVTKGTNPGEFYVSDSSGKKTMVSSPDLAAHAGKQVKVTGSMDKSPAGSDVFKASKIEVIAETCSAGA
jgi:hypothetical protein